MIILSAVQLSGNAAGITESITKLSKTAPYEVIPAQGNANWGGIDKEFIQVGGQLNFDRIRQNGTIYKIRFAVRNVSTLTQFNFTVWRLNGSNYDRIATTDNLVDNISNGINEINLSPPLEGIREGDFYGYRIKASNPGNPLYIVDENDPDHLTYEISGATSYINFNWSAQAYHNKIFVIEPYMVNPYMIFIGDSIIKGDLTSIPTTIENHWGIKVNKSYQNMGYGGQSTSSINNRFNADVVDLSPEFVLIEGGVNDVNSSNYNTSNILANWES
ncbi:MAG: hypothetical protein OIN87_05455, partial [Candidatus Methanoperedens sp.]|nr:hypothetical protein [Candidatus Methanoperedens sp.]